MMGWPNYPMSAMGIASKDSRIIYDKDLSMNALDELLILTIEKIDSEDENVRRDAVKALVAIALTLAALRAN